MSDAEDEGLGFIGALRERFSGKLDRAEERMRAERRAGMTEGEKLRRKGPPRQLFDALAQHFKESKTDVMARAVEALSKATPGFIGGKRE